MNLHEIFSEEVIIPSKMNELTLRELYFLYPDTEVPTFPTGIIWLPERSVFRASRRINNKKMHIRESKQFTEVVMALEDFCKQHKIKV